MPVPKVYYNNDPKSFAFSTCQQRWPKIIQGTIDDVAEAVSKSSNEEYKAQGAIIESQLKTLKKDLANDGPMGQFNEPNVPGLNSYDETLSKLSVKPTWFTGPWLFTECYLYRRINLFFVKQPLWQHYDVFDNLKRGTFKSSSVGVAELAARFTQLDKQLSNADVDHESLKLLFTEFADISLWGNATDLSLLANATLEDIKSVQGAEARKKSAKNVIANDLDEAWKALYGSTSENKRVDIVLDNSGFELYADLLLALFLLDAKLVAQIVLHCKAVPWMVSDVMLKDFDILIADMRDSTFFSENRSDLDFLASKIESYHKQGKIQLQAHQFWTIDLDYSHISPEETKYGGAEVHSELIKSDLIIFKGDLNYRKLSGDRMWPRSTPFVKGIGALASSGIKLLSLRTCKADVCLGLEEGKDEELCALWEAEGNEQGQLWCSSGKWAVMSYSDGNNK